MLTAMQVRHRLQCELVTIADDYQVDIEDRMYTEAEYQGLMHLLLNLRELNMDPDNVGQLLAIN